MKEFKLEQFSGPLDLLLNLIDEEKLDISEISLSAVTEQFLNYLEKLENKKPEELADFLVVAARLLLLKSKKLLPLFTPEEEEGPTLEEQLRLYKMFVEAAKKINQRWLSGKEAIFRIEPPHRPEQFLPPANFSLLALQESFSILLRRLQPPKPMPETSIDRTILLEEKIKNIRALLKKAGQANFSEILNNAQNRTEVIVTFLALLELVKGQQVALKQKKSFQEIVVERV